ncbi:MAG: hypothetical protein NVV59_05360 [Chitinophagaceae bacterium]|nr:hypothetical protein [Chitinophagaceae bacterium]
MKYFLFLSILFFTIMGTQAQEKTSFTKADTLRGSNGPGRSWWDVLRYDLSVSVDIEKKSIKGKNSITYKITKDG